MKILISVLAFIWFLGWGFWFLYDKGHINLTSSLENQVAVSPINDTISTELEPPPPPSFLKNHPPADSIDAIIDSLMAKRKPGEAIQVISFYKEGEPYTGMNENPGIQRSINLMANAQKRYASRVLQPMGLKLMEGKDTTGISTYYQVVKVNKKSLFRIINDQRVLVFFPFASKNERTSSKISDPLDSLTNIWKAEKNHLIITGYTDNSADETINYNLGLERAKSIQQRIVDNGFPENKITTLSRGEKDPISINTTSDGRYLNRRVEILVDK